MRFQKNVAANKNQKNAQAYARASPFYKLFKINQLP